METNLIKQQLISKNSIIFGPNLMELGWEIMRWSGIAKFLRMKGKEIIIWSFEDRYDLYHGKIDKFYPLNFTKNI